MGSVHNGGDVGMPGSGLSLRFYALARALEDRGHVTDEAMADALGVTPSRLWRLRHGVDSPDANFVAHVVSLFGDQAFSQFFVVHVPDKPQAAAGS